MDKDTANQTIFLKEFLQSKNWLNFQEKVGRTVYFFQNENTSANIIEHLLPIVGNYFYIPRGPIVKENADLKEQFKQIFILAHKANAAWIRIEPENEEILTLIKEKVDAKIVKAPHDMQPKEIFALDITKSEEQLLGEMKAKTRYNINLAKKKGVRINKGREFFEQFWQLTTDMAKRQGIVTHPREYYEKMLASFPEQMLQIYVAQYQGQIIAANLILFFGDTATYLHGASGNEHRNVMAPFLLQWQCILEARGGSFAKYDFGGIKTQASKGHSWEGITNFKLGFSPQTKPVVFPGSYDIILNSRKYAVYRGLQKAKSFAVRFRR